MKTVKNLNLWRHTKRMLMLPLLAVSLSAFAQSENSKASVEKIDGWLTVTGKVVNADTKEPIERACVYVVGRDFFVLTDKDGEFAVLAKEWDAIHISHGAMRSQSIIVKDEQPQEVAMTYDCLEMEQMVVMGYMPSRKELEKVPRKEPDPYEGCLIEFEAMPEYPGGMAECIKFLAKNLKYPEAALEARIQGRVLVGFTIETDGTLTDIRTLGGVCPELDEEAKRVVGLMPKWRPGVWHGKRIAMRYSLPVEFRLQKHLLKNSLESGEIKVGYGERKVEWLSEEE